MKMGKKSNTTKSIFDMRTQDALEDKRIVAGIVKSFVPEYAALSVQEIADLITYLPTMSAAQTSTAGEESTSLGGTVRFEAAMPGSGHTGEFLVDVVPSAFDSLMEAQLRDLGYLAYLISLTCDGDWDKLENAGDKRFFTVSVYRNPPEGYEDDVLMQSLPGDAITRNGAPAQLRSEIGAVPNYVTMVSVFLGNADPAQEFSLGFANTVFDTEMSSEEKMRRLWDEFGLPMDEDLPDEISG